MFKLVKHDLEFILKQIKIAENHVKSGYGSYADAQGNPIGGLVPYGLRTVSGEYNNLTNVTFGSASRMVAGSFTAGSSYTLARVDVYVATVGTPVRDITCRIWSTTGTTPNTAIGTESAAVSTSRRRRRRRAADP